MARITPDRSRAIFGYPSLPAEVTEYQFDGFDDDLRRMAQTPWDKLSYDDLWYYIHDLSYMELQPDLFTYLFPFCLNFWYDTLLNNTDCARGDADFHYALHHGQILEKMVTPRQREQIYDFFHDGFLDRIDLERGFVYNKSKTPAYGWMMRFNSLGLITPLIERVWTSWWSMESAGQAVSALMYLSGLMYAISENPIFKPWTREDGGGGPPLWERDSMIFDQGWLAVNLDFFRRTLTIDYFRQKAKTACERLKDEPEADMAAKICADYEGLSEIVEIRILYLLDRLAENNPIYGDW